MDTEKICKILLVNLKYNFLPHFLTAALITGVTPVVFGVAQLNERQAAQPVEMLLSLMGIALLTPVFMPEQNKEIRKAIWMRKIDYIWIILIRLLYSIAAAAVLLGGFLLFMKRMESAVGLQHFFGGMITAFFLGALGFAAAGICENTIAGYMISLVYYIVNLGMGKKLGSLFLFSMTAGSFREKYFLMAAAIMLTGVTIFIFHRRAR